MSTERIEAQLGNISKTVRLFRLGRISLSALELVPEWADNARLELARQRVEDTTDPITRAFHYLGRLIRKGV